MGSLISPAYAELLCRTHYSFLRGGSHPHELVERAAELGLHSLAVTDLNGVYGMPKAYQAKKAHPKLGLIVGAEVTLESAAPLTLLAQDRRAYGLLCRILTAAHADKPKGEARLSWAELWQLLREPGASTLLAIPREEASLETPYSLLSDQFGDRLLLPLSRHLDGRDRERTERTLELKRQFPRSRIIATNDVHYHVPERRKLQDVVTAIREGVRLDDAGHLLFSNHERYLKSPREMAELFRDLPEALLETVRVAESCTFSPAELRYRYPSEWIPPGETAQSHLDRITRDGALKRYPSGIPEAVLKQIDYELALIAQLQFADYFLTIWEIVEFARQQNILCQGRGSAANSVVCYCLGITAIDPIRMNLLFERFISVERGEPPDIDVDFEHERREEVIQHVYEKYGRHRAAMVAAIITYRTKSSHREVAKVLGVPQEQAREHPAVMRLADELHGFPRHLSIHSGGFTLSADPIIETVPVEPARMEGRTIIQWDKEDLDFIGLLKVDLLALGMLTALHRTLDLTGLKLETIPADDQPTYRMICRADTVGVFQIESRAQMSMLPRLLPKNFYDLVIQIAIVRPGPIVGKMVHPYLKRRRGLEPVTLPDERLKPILDRTLGVPLFQEQVMKIAIVLGGFTPGEADHLRRAIGAWRSSGSINQLGQKLLEGLVRNGIPQEFAERIFLQIQGFAEYGFPESHAASFALLAYASSYLKCHRPAEFTCSLINSQPMGFYANHTLVDDAKRHGVTVLPVDPNQSDWDCRMEGKALRLGLRVVEGMSRAEGDAIVAERKAQGPYTSLTDFLARVALRKNVFEGLAMGDAFAGFGIDQRQALWQGLAHDVKARAHEITGEQLGLFARTEPQDSSAGLFRGLTAYEEIQSDYTSYGLSTRGHPMTEIRKMLPTLPQLTTVQAKRLAHGKRGVQVAGLMLVLQRPPTAKGTCFGTLEDETGFLDLLLKKEVYEEYRELFAHHACMVVTGMIQRDGYSVCMIARHFEAFIDPEAQPREAATRNFGTGILRR